MSPIRSVITLALVMIPATVVAQSASPIADALRDSQKEEMHNLVAAAEVMPAEKYGFKPTPAQMSFGEMVLHVAGGSTFLCASISGQARPNWPRLAPTVSKDSLIGRLKASEGFCASALASLDDSKLADMVPWFGGQQVTQARAIVDLAADWADHYSQAAIYLRLNGLLPPTARPE